MLTPDFPKRVEIELSNSCNLHCTYCPRNYLDNPGGFIDEKLFRKVIDEITPFPDTILVLHRRGESLLHPKFNILLGYVSGKFKEIQMATNATLLEPSKFKILKEALTFISFSIDIPSVFDRMRKPAKYSVVEGNILKFLEFNKGKVRTQVSMVRTTDTPEENIELFKKIWDGKVDRIRIYEEHSIDGVFGSIRNPRKERKPCAMTNYELLVYFDGKVGRCNHDWASEPMGDLNRQTIHEIWHGKKYADLRQQHFELALTDPVCAKCDSWYPEEGQQGTGEVFER